MTYDCKDCARPLRMDEIALHKRLIDRGTNRFMCLTCMAKYFGVSETVLREKAEHFRCDGCTLFCTEPDLPPEEG